jgi:hypothetical protein
MIVKKEGVREVVKGMVRKEVNRRGLVIPMMRGGSASGIRRQGSMELTGAGNGL